MSDSNSNSPPGGGGYGKPPKATQFKKGQSGNPKGRRKKNRGDSGKTHQMLDDILSELVTVRIGETERKITKHEYVIRALVNKALKGEVRALERIRSIIEQPDEILENPGDAIIHEDTGCFTIEEHLARGHLLNALEEIDAFEQRFDEKCKPLREIIEVRDAPMDVQLQKLRGSTQQPTQNMGGPNV